MKRILFILVMTICASGMRGMSRGHIRQETRFLSDKMAYELELNDMQYNDVYEINYDFVSHISGVMDNVLRGEEWAMDEYYDALEIRNDELRWVLSDRQYRRFLGMDYFYRPVHVVGGIWSLRIYLRYPNRHLFYYGVPTHYHSYCGAHYRPHFHHVSYYRGRYGHLRHYATSSRIRQERKFHSYRRSDFGSIRFRSNTSNRPQNMPRKPGREDRPAVSAPSRVERQNGSGSRGVRSIKQQRENPKRRRETTAPAKQQRRQTVTNTQRVGFTLIGNGGTVRESARAGVRYAPINKGRNEHIYKRSIESENNARR